MTRPVTQGRGSEPHGNRDDGEIIDVQSGDSEDIDMEEVMEDVQPGSKRTKTCTHMHPRKLMDFMRLGGRDRGLVGIRKIRAFKKLDKLEEKHRSNIV